MRVAVVGSNPSSASSTLAPFDPSTKSGTILSGWMMGVSCEIVTMNVSNVFTLKNRALRRSEIVECLPELRKKLEQVDRIVTLGKTADEAVSMLDLPHFAACHPSGLNRKLNDREYTADMVRRLREYCSENVGPDLVEGDERT